MSVSIKYKGTEIASAGTEVTKTIKTAGKYCEADILVENTPDGGDAPVINPLTVTENGTYTAPSGVDGYSPVTVNVPQGITPTGKKLITDTSETDVTNYATAQVVDADLVAENIKDGVNILGVVGTFAGGGSFPSSISKIDGGSFIIASDTASNNYTIQHSLDASPKMVVVWTEDEDLVNSMNAQTRNYLFNVLLFNNPYLSGTTMQAFSSTYQYRATNGNASSTSGGNITTAQLSTYFTATTFKLTLNTAWYKAGVTYNWIAWA